MNLIIMLIKNNLLEEMIQNNNHKEVLILF